MSDLQQFDLQPGPRGTLTLKREGHDDIPEVRIRRAMPWSKPDQWISIRNKDGKEVHLIEDLSALPRELRVRVEGALETGSFIPTIRSIERVDVSFGFQTWTVETDRGRAEFRVQEREDIRFLDDGRFTLKDADGNLYLLPRLDKLDEASRIAVRAIL